MGEALLPILVFLFSLHSYGDQTILKDGCAGTVVGAPEYVHLGESYFLTGGQNGPLKVDWQPYVGKRVEVQVEKNSNKTIEKNPQRVLEVGGSDPETLPASLIATARADATFLVPTGKPLHSNVIFNDVIIYAAEWNGVWHRSKPISVNENNSELLNRIHSAELDGFLSLALEQKATRFAVLGFSANAAPIMRETNLNSVVEQLRATLPIPVAGYFVPWKAQPGQDFIFLKAD